MCRVCKNSRLGNQELGIKGKQSNPQNNQIKSKIEIQSKPKTQLKQSRYKQQTNAT
jgi:hypothetical protein